MSALGQAVDSYLAARRALGFKLERDGRLLGDFAAFLEQADLATVTIDAALGWACRSAGSRHARAGRLAVVRGFARWLAAFDPATQVPPAGLLAARSRRAEPYPYTDGDIAALLRAARVIPTPLKAATYQTLIGLLAVTGMRVGEAIGLDRADIGWGHGLLVVRAGKLGKSRELVVHPTTIDALRAYTSARDLRAPRPGSAAFFVSTAGTRLIYKNVHRQWVDLARRAGLRPRSPRRRPRLHEYADFFVMPTRLGSPCSAGVGAVMLSA